MTGNPLTQYTDDQLLIELRRRGRIARVEASDVTPARLIEDYTPRMQFKGLMMLCAHEVYVKLGTHRAIPGATTVDVPGQPKGRRMTMALNVIVNKEYGS